MINKAVLVRVNIKQAQQAIYTSELSRSAAPQGLVRVCAALTIRNGLT